MNDRFIRELERLWRKGSFKRIERLLRSEVPKDRPGSITAGLWCDLVVGDRKKTRRRTPLAIVGTVTQLSPTASRQLDEDIKLVRNGKMTRTSLQRRFARAEQQFPGRTGTAFMRMDHLSGPVCDACHGLGFEFKVRRGRASASADRGRPRKKPNSRGG